MIERRRPLVLRGIADDVVLVSSRHVANLGTQRSAVEWVRTQLRQSASFRNAAASRLASEGSAEIEWDESAIRTLARAIANGELVVLRLDEPLPALEPPPMVNLADLAEPTDEPAAAPSPRAVPTWFELALVDDAHQPISDVPITFLVDGVEHRVATGQDGHARIGEVAATSSKVWIPATDQLRAGLERAMARPAQAPVDADDSVEVVHFREDLIGPVSLRPESVRTVSVRPLVVLGRLAGMAFDTDRSFLLPVALSAVAELRALYERCVPCKLLVVGHTDTKGDSAYNQELSLQRAEATMQYLTDDVDGWLARFGDEVPKKARWGEAEERMMFESLDDYADRPPGQDPVTWFQSTRGLTADGDLGPVTRRALVLEYMKRDGTTLPESIDAIAHGCGEAFPLSSTGEELDQAPVDGMDDPIDRRVELFFFCGGLGISPAPSGSTSDPSSSQYRFWRHSAKDVVEKVVGARALEIVLEDERGNPVPHARYEVRLPVGLRVEGQLDGQGRARLDRLPFGSLRVDFPDLERGFAVVGTSPLPEAP